MENNFGLDYYHQHMHKLSRDTNSSGFPFNNDPVLWEPCTVDDFTATNFPCFPVSALQQSKASEPNNSSDWVHLKPHVHQIFAPISNSPASLFEFGQQRGCPAIGTQPAEKRFLVFDQSGDKTTLLYSSGVHTPVQFGDYGVPNAPPTYNLMKEQMATNNNHLCEENVEDYSGEDTEELNALLCSDDNSNSSEDDEMSTGHSPSTMTDNGPPKSEDETGEEVDSFLVPAKRRKLQDGGYDAPSLKTVSCSALESNAESSGGNGGKGSRKQKIHETVRILQSIVPNTAGKDMIVVIDEAIRYMKSMKAKAKEFGFGAI